MNNDLIPCHADHLIWRELSDGVVLISPKIGTVRVLNEIGSQVWRLIDGSKTVANIVAVLLLQYRVSSDNLHSDLESFFQDLETRDLIQWKESS